MSVSDFSLGLLLQVSVGAAAGTSVVRVMALDHDKGDNGRISYSIFEGECFWGGRQTFVLIDKNISCYNTMEMILGYFFI